MRLSTFILVMAALSSTGCATLGAYPGSVRGNPEVGYASFYASRYHGRPTASGKAYDERGFTAAHRTLPFGTRVRVTNLANHRSVVVTVTDRGPFRRDRIIDLSKRAASELGSLRDGVMRVRVEIVSG